MLYSTEHGLLNRRDIGPTPIVMLSDKQKTTVLQHLKKVLASSEFSRSERAASFLEFIVTCTLNEEQGSLRERAIGVSIFEREEDWDPKLDTTVRTEARRLRKKLTTFYQSPAGEDHNVVIDVPVGSYIPTFAFRWGDSATPFAAVKTDDVTAEQPASQMPSGLLPTTSPRWPKWFALCATVCLASLAVLVLMKRTASGTPASTQVLPITSAYGHEISPSISPDGKQIAYVWDEGKGDYRIYLKPVDNGTQSRLTNEEATELDPAWSPDGKRIAFLRIKDGITQVVVHSITEGKERLVGEIQTQLGDWTGAPGPLIGDLGPAWLPDSTGVIVSDSFPHTSTSGLVSLRIADGSREQLTSSPGSSRDFLPRISADGKTLAFVRALSHGISDIYLMDREHHEFKKLTNEARSINGLAWMQDARHLLFSSNREVSYQLWSIALDNGTIEKMNTDSSNAMEPQLSPDSSWIAYVTTSQNWNVYRITLGTSPALPKTERVIASSGRNHSARYSPDGKHIAFVSDRSGAWEIWFCDASCHSPEKLTDFRGPWIGGVSWSPDSQKLAFDARLGRNSAIYVMPLSHPTPQVVEQNAFEERMPSWSQDGKSIYFNSDRDGTVAIWNRDLQSNALRKLATGFMVRDTGSHGLMIGHSDGSLWNIKNDGSDVSRLAANVSSDPVLAWTTHGNIVYFCSANEHTGIQINAYDGTHVRLVTVVPFGSPITSASIDVSPDGKSFLLTAVDQSSSNIFRRVTEARR